MLSKINQPARLKITLVLTLLYWLDISLLSLPGAETYVPDSVLPVTMAVGLPVLALATWLTLRSDPQPITALN